MSTRLQVVVDDAELRRFQHAAQRQGVTLSEWVRAALRLAERSGSGADPSAKLAAVRTASRHEFPAPAVEDHVPGVTRTG